MPDNVLFAFALTLFAGLSTGVGSALAFFNRRHNEKFLASALGFSAGVMLYVSFMEIMPKATEALARDMPGGSASWLSAAAFFGGVLLAGIIDRLVPSYENPHEIHRVAEMDDPSERARFQKLYKTGMFTALAIAIHNFPEGLATFIAALDDPALGVPIAVAIAIHNIPEGIAVSVPIYYATSSRRRAFGLSFASGLSEPLGALVGFLLLMPFLNGIMFGLLFASVAGIMVFISLDELLPAAREYGEHHLSIYGLVAGMAVMAVSLLLFQ